MTKINVGKKINMTILEHVYRLVYGMVYECIIVLSCRLRLLQNKRFLKFR